MGDLLPVASGQAKGTQRSCNRVRGERQAELVNPTTEMYPSLDELIAACDSMVLPDSLIQTLARRYNEHGMGYASEFKHEDGRTINRCMLKDSILDAQEELNDAIFNLLVAILKQGKGYQQKGIHTWQPRAALSHLLQAWTALSPSKASGTSL